MDDPCREMQDLLAGRILGLLDQKQANVLNDHLGRCLKCRKYLQSLANENRLLVRFSENIETTMTVRRDRVIQALNRAGPTTRTEALPMWRTIMKSKITKLAVAAVVILIAIFSIILLDRSTTPAWAIEDAVEALDRIDAIYLSGTVPKLVPPEGPEVILEDEKISFEIWVKANKERTKSGNARFKLDNGKLIGVIYDMTTYSYDASAKTVLIETGQKLTIDPWISSELARQNRESREDFQVMYGKDPATGRHHALVTFVNSAQSTSFCVEYDVETKLPIRAKAWPNTRREGVPAMDCQRHVYFEELPDEFFKFEIPEGATVIDKRQD